MNRKLVWYLLGNVLMISGATMLPSMFVAIYDHERAWQSLLLSAFLQSGTGFILSRFKPQNDTLRIREGFVTVALCWICMSLFGCLPFVLGGYIPNFIDAFFECVSGYTTTGATILNDVEALPRSILFWRSATHWIGGMGVLVLTLALIPRMGSRSLYLLRAETTGPAPGKIVPKLGSTAKILYIFYVALTILLVGILLLCGMNPFDALIHAMGTAGTGGFSNYSASVGHFQNPAVDIVLSIFMLLFSVNFSLYFLIWQKDFKQFFHNEELHVFCGIVGVSILAISINILPTYGSFWTSLRHSLFQVSSIISTSGFATVDFNLWPQFSRTVLILLMFIGACAGSTGGGMKVIRVSLLFKTIRRELHNVVRPHSVETVRSEGRSVDENILSQVAVFFFIYILIILSSTLLLSFDGLDFETNFTSALSAVSNIGPGFGLTGPSSSFAVFSGFSKFVLCIDMLLGRLELYPIILLFTPTGWKRNIGSKGGHKE